MAWSRIQKSPQDAQKQSVHIWWAESTAPIGFSEGLRRTKNIESTKIRIVHHLLSLYFLLVDQKASLFLAK